MFSLRKIICIYAFTVFSDKNIRQTIILLLITTSCAVHHIVLALGAGIEDGGMVGREARATRFTAQPRPGG